MLLKVELAPSRLLHAGIAILHLLALVSLLFTEIPLLLRLSLAIGLICHFLLGRPCLQPSGILFSDDLIRLYFPDRDITVVLESQCYCTPWVQMLYFHECLQNTVMMRCPNSSTFTRRRHAARYCVILLPDSCHATIRRRLAVLLRWQRFAPESNAA